MLVLSRKLDQKILIGDNITVTVLEVGPNRVQLGFSAPRDVSIMRSELVAKHEQDVGHESEGDAVAQAVRDELRQQGLAESLPPSVVADRRSIGLVREPRGWAPSATSSAPLIRPPSRLGPTSLRQLIAARRRS